MNMYKITKLDVTQMWFLNYPYQYKITDSLNPNIFYYSENYKTIDNILFLKGITLEPVKVILSPTWSTDYSTKYFPKSNEVELPEEIFNIIKQYFSKKKLDKNV